MSDVVAYWSEEIECTATDCEPTEHSRMEWHTLGMVCGRCNKHTGNETQGHYWGLCKRLTAQGVPWKHAIIDLHFCCPDDCELTSAAPKDADTEGDA